MKAAKGDERGLKLSRLKKLRLVLIALAVVLAVAMGAVYGLYLHAPAEDTVLPEETVPSTTQQTVTETEPAATAGETQAQETTAPADEETQPETTGPAVTEETQPETMEPAAPEDGLPEAAGPDETQGATLPPETNEPPVLVKDQVEESVETTVPTEETQGAPEEKNSEELKPLYDPSATTDATEAVTETTGEAVEETTQPAAPSDGEDGNFAKILFVVLSVLLGADLLGIVIVSVMIRAEQKKLSGKAPEIYAPTQQTVGQTAKTTSNGLIAVGMVHGIGARPYQEDSLGMIELEDGALAVVADGMGGLSGGDKVSQKIVGTLLSYGQTLRPDKMDGVLERMVMGVNQEVNRMLGPDGIYKSGSTLLSVLIRRNRFHWITVGDSRIYFYRQGKLVQLNQEHNVGQELLMRAARGEISYEEARNAPKKNRVTSFIGMGNLKYVDKSNQSIALAPGDRILLLTDGVFNALPDQTILAVLNHYHSVEDAAAELERMIMRKANPRQDNYTAIILGF